MSVYVLLKTGLDKINIKHQTVNIFYYKRCILTNCD